jgi:hypothetical protein
LKIGEFEILLECIDGIQLNLPADKISRIFTGELGKTKTTLEDLFHKGQPFAFKVVRIGPKNGKFEFGYF